MLLRTIVALLLSLTAAAGFARASGFDHSAFDALLKAHVVDGLVDYDAFKKATEFRGYLDALAKADPAALPEPDRLAFWINAYNAYTIELINKHGERDSIRNINKSLGLKLKGPWKEKLAVVGAMTYHLDNIEHDIIRKTFKEPRIHYALVCAAMGCPPLRSEAYAGDRLDDQLTDQARAFLTKSPAKNRVDVAAKTVYVSMILGKYYRDDFGGTDDAIGKHIARFWPDGAERALLETGGFKLSVTDYDWTLNSQEKGRMAKKAAAN